MGKRRGGGGSEGGGEKRGGWQKRERENLHCKKKLADFPCLDQDVYLTKLSLVKNIHIHSHTFPTHSFLTLTPLTTPPSLSHLLEEKYGEC